MRSTLLLMSVLYLNRLICTFLDGNAHELRNEIDSGKKINESVKRSSREPKRRDWVYISLEAFSPERREQSEALCAQVKGVEQHVAPKSDLFFPLFVFSQAKIPDQSTTSTP